MGSPRKLTQGMKSKNSSYNERGPAELSAATSMRSNASTGQQHPISLREHPMLQDHMAAGQPHSPNAASALPPVQIGSNQNSFSSKGPGQPPNLAAMMLPSGNGRRKSTPAALDMALRTAEGKAAVEQLLQPQGHNKLVFGNYFAGTSAAARDQAAAVAAAEKQRAKAAAAGIMPAPPTYAKPQGLYPPGTIPAHKPQQLPALQLHQANDANMSTVPEDVAMQDARNHHHAAPSSSKKHPADSVPSMQASAPQSPSGAHKQHAPAAYHQPVPPPQPQPPMPSPLRPQPPPQPAAEEPPASSRSVGKLVSLSPQLPAAMQRKHWSLSDYNIIRKMYTGYASTVFQVRQGSQGGRSTWGVCDGGQHWRTNGREQGHGFGTARELFASWQRRQGLPQQSNISLRARERHMLRTSVAAHLAMAYAGSLYRTPFCHNRFLSCPAGIVQEVAGNGGAQSVPHAEPVRAEPLPGVQGNPGAQQPAAPAHHPPHRGVRGEFLCCRSSAG